MSFGWIEKAVNQVGSWIGIDTRSKADKEEAQLAQSAQNLAQDQFRDDSFWNQQNYEEQKRQFELNYQHSLDKYEYDKALQQTMFNREDTSVQRRTADLKAAGINPILAAGQGASAGPVVTTTAPHGEAASRQAMIEQKNYERQIAFERRMAAGQMVMNMLKMRSEIQHTEADTRRIYAQTSREDKYYDLDMDRHELALRYFELDNSRLSNEQKRLVLDSSRHDLERAQYNLHAKREQIERIRLELQNEKITEETALFRLQREEKFPREIAMIAMDYNIKLNDLQWSINNGLRYKDSLNMLERGVGRIQNAIQKNKNNAVDRAAEEILNKATGGGGSAGRRKARGFTN